MFRTLGNDIYYCNLCIILTLLYKSEMLSTEILTHFQLDLHSSDVLRMCCFIFNKRLHLEIQSQTLRYAICILNTKLYITCIWHTGKIQWYILILIIYNEIYLEIQLYWTCKNNYFIGMKLLWDVYETWDFMRFYESLFIT